MRQLTAQEAGLREREGAWRAEEGLRRERLEALLSNAQAEARIVRERAAADVADERSVSHLAPTVSVVSVGMLYLHTWLTTCRAATCSS